jgi:hypothetical protein
VYRVALVLVTAILFLCAYALVAHLFAGANLYARPETDLYAVATSILGALLWAGVLLFSILGLRRQHRLVFEPWRRWPVISKAVLVLMGSSLLKHLTVLVSVASFQAGVSLETVTLALRVAGWAILALGLLRGEKPLAELMDWE